MGKQASARPVGWMVPCSNPACREERYYSPSKAMVRRYCSEACERAHKRPVTTAWSVIERLGGTKRVAERLGVTRRAVVAWGAHGIPSKFHFAVIKVVNAEKLGADITFETLQRSVAEGRALRSATNK